MRNRKLMSKHLTTSASTGAFELSSHDVNMMCDRLGMLPCDHSCLLISIDFTLKYEGWDVNVPMLGKNHTLLSDVQ
jgi:hypothetical protein